MTLVQFILAFLAFNLYGCQCIRHDLRLNLHLFQLLLQNLVIFINFIDLLLVLKALHFDIFTLTFETYIVSLQSLDLSAGVMFLLGGCCHIECQFILFLIQLCNHLSNPVRFQTECL